MVFRFILYTLIAYLALRLIRHFVAALPPAKAKSARINRGSHRAAAPAKGARSARLVRCARCGVFVAESSALAVKDAEFCSKMCAEAGAVHRA